MVRRLTSVVIAVAILCAMTASAEQIGLWPDEIVFFQTEDAGAARSALRRGDAQLASVSFDAWTWDRYADIDGVEAVESHGTSYELWLNPAAESGALRFADGRGNPFAVAEVREALRSLIDREAIACHLATDAGLRCTPRWSALDPRFDFGAHVLGPCGSAGLAPLNAREEALSSFEAAMEGAGFERVDEVWTCEFAHWRHAGPVRIVGLEVVEVGSDLQGALSYEIAQQLEALGFAVDLRLCSPSEAERIWRCSDPLDGEWDFYVRPRTPASIDRDSLDDLDPYAPSICPWTSSLGEFPSTWEQMEWFLAEAVREQLVRGRFASWDEWAELLRQADAEASCASFRMELVDAPRSWLRAGDVEAVSDLAAGIGASYLWGHTVRFVDEDGDPDPGGRIDVACPGLLEAAWNPIGGTRSTAARMVQRATEDWFLVPDPHTGLFVPHLVDRAVCTVPHDLPMEATHEYVSVEYEDEIPVPGDAWCAWSAGEARFVTVGERYPDGVTSRTKTSCTFVEDLFDNRWQDGSRFSVADMVMRFIWRFETCDEVSYFYDEAGGYEAARCLHGFKAARIASTDPLTIEVWDDRLCREPETQVFERIGELFWPHYGAGMAPWHTIVSGLITRDGGSGPTFWETREAYYAGFEVTDQQNWLVWPTMSEFGWLLEELADRASRGELTRYDVMVHSAIEGLCAFLDGAELNARFANLARFVEEYGHLWIGNGPMRIDLVDVEDGRIYGARFDGYRHDVSKWLAFGEPEPVEIVFDEEEYWVDAGEPLTIGLRILTGEGEPLSTDQIALVSYRVLHMDMWDPWDLGWCDLVPHRAPPILCGAAEVVEGGQARIELDGEATELLLQYAADTPWCLESSWCPEEVERYGTLCWIEVTVLLEDTALAVGTAVPLTLDVSR